MLLGFPVSHKFFSVGGGGGGGGGGGPAANRLVGRVAYLSFKQRLVGGVAYLSLC